MREIHLKILVIFLVAVSSACAIPKKTPVMANIKGLDMTADQLRLKVAGFVVIFAGEVEHAADQIIDRSGSREVKDRALAWKTNAISTAQLAAFQFDPLIGLLDMWAFTTQMRAFFTTGVGRDLFGPQQSIAIHASETIENEVTHFVEALGSSVNLEKAKAFVEEWVKKNPLQNLLFARRSTNISLAAYASKPQGIGEVLGGIDEPMTDMATRMNIFMQQMPKHSIETILGIL